MYKTFLILISLSLLQPQLSAQSLPDTIQKVRVLFKKASELLDRRLVNEAFETNEIAVQIITRNQIADTPLVRILYHQKALLLTRTNQCREADSLINILLINYEGTSDSLITNRMSLIMGSGDCYRRENLDTSISRYKKALALHRSRGVEVDEFSGSINNKLGICYRNKGEHEISIEYYKKAYNIYKVVYPGLNSRIGAITLNMGEVYRDLNKVEQAEAMFEESLKNDIAEVGPDHPYISTTYNSLGNLHKYLGEYEIAIEYFEKALKIREKHYRPTDQRISTILNNLGLVYERIPNYEKTLYYLKQSLEISKSNFNNEGPEMALAYDNISNVLSVQGKYNESLISHMAAMNALSSGPDLTEIYQNPALEDLPLQGHVHKHIADKAQSELRKFQNDGDQKALIASIESFDLLFDYVTERHAKLTNESAQLYLSDYVYHQYSNAIEATFLAYNLDKDSIFIQKGFEFAEKGKSFQLLSAFRNDMAILSSGIPKELILNEDSLENELAILKNKMRNELNLNPDTLSQLRDKFLIVQQALNEIKEILRVDYSNYFELKYGNKISTITELQKNILSKNEILIEFHLDENELTRIAIDKDHVSFDFEVLDSIEIKSIYSFLENVHDISITPSSFALSSSAVFKILFDGLEERINNKKILIVPSAEINYIPFEALIKKIPTDKKLTYLSLPYLVNDHSISYVFSATILEETHHKKTSLSNGFLGFAPTFLNPANHLFANKNIKDRSELLPLDGAENEVRAITKIMHGISRYGEDATEEAFKELAKESGILHLATHALIDNNDPLQSKLLFSVPEAASSENNGALYAWEIYHMKLQASMAVLSACNTGTGKIKRGEGAMSLGRAFAYAGCPSTIMSLWPANDESTIYLMEEFYQGIKEGFVKSEALRSSKLKHLKNADALLAHPFYWAPFVLQGDDRPIQFSKVNYKLIFFGLLLGGIILAFIGFLIYRKKLTQTHHPHDHSD